MIKKNKIPTILGILLLFGGVFAGVFLLKKDQVFKIGAGPTITPKNVRVSNLTDTSATVSWITDDQTAGFISYGTSQNTGTVINETENDEKFSTHSITLTGLSPNSDYFFKINSEGSTFDNNGVPWQFTTGSSLPISQTAIPVSGTVISASSDVIKRAIVYITINGYAISTLTSESGTFVLQLGSTRTTDLLSYAQIDSAKTLLEVSAVAPGGEVATAKIFPQAANPIPALIIGRDQDFRNLKPSLNGENPSADLNLPESATTESKLDVSGEKIIQTKSVTLESISEGEVVTSEKPEFFGEGPVGTEVSITVNSENQISGTSKVSTAGLWNWSPPTNLAPGSHSVTISWVDTSGIKRTLTRNFVVQAGELPAFVATPSATPKSTPTSTPARTPTPTPKPTSLPTSTPSATNVPTPVPSKTPSSVETSLPQSGSLTPTILLFMMGLVILSFSFYTWKMSNK